MIPHGKERLERSTTACPSASLEVLVADADAAWRARLACALRSEGHSVLEASNGAVALELLRLRACDVAIVDVCLTEIDGLSLLRAARRYSPHTVVIVTTFLASIRDAVLALREGAYDYLSKPIDITELVSVEVGHIAEHIAVRREIEQARRALARKDMGDDIVGESCAIALVRQQLDIAATSDAPVWIAGESGTGKHLIARTLHARSPRRSGPWIEINCRHVDEATRLAAWFGDSPSSSGHGKGALEAAACGTLFLSDVESLPRSAQSALVRTLDTQPLSDKFGNQQNNEPRIISSSEVSADKLLCEGRILRDLAGHLRTLEISIPPLRDRKADIPILISHFLNTSCPGRVPPSIHPDAWEALHAYPYPGNVRELSCAIKHALAYARGGEIALQHLPANIVAGHPLDGA